MAKEIVAQQRREVLSRQSSGMAGRLERVVLRGFDRIDQYLDMEIADKNEELRRRQSDLATSLIRTQAKLDEGALRAQSDEKFLSILERVTEEALPAPTEDE